MPTRFDADDATHAFARRGGDADQRDHLLRRELRHGRAALVRVARGDVHLGEQRLLALDDMTRHVLGEILDQERVVVDDSLDRLLEELGEAGHVHALLRRVEGRPCSRSSRGSASRGCRARCGLPSARR